ncbi:MAG: NAD(P)/FAD-dependent oxidoreductase, partial [Pseudomonadota bacterium]|nr:NAD(P)/FAD-dependent oxidoreductase [Pseudomonadota bacterium]
RVRAINESEILLEEGSVPTDQNTLHIDCAGDGLAKRPPLPIFAGKKVVLQSVRTCQQVFSAAFIGHVEATYQEDDEKNQLCIPVPHPNTDIDFLRNNLADSINLAKWAEDPKLQRWLQNCRLDFSSHVLNSSPSMKIISLLSKIPFFPIPNRVVEAQAKASRNIERLLKELDS